MHKLDLILAVLVLSMLLNISATILCHQLYGLQRPLRDTMRMKGLVSEPKIPKWEPSYVGDDFPKSLPIDFTGQISTTIEESIRFRLNDHPSVPQAWMANVPSGIGYVRLGPEHRIFAISMYHELHCLLKIHRTIVSRSGPTPHIQHCFAYIRQSILCAADLNLEPIDFRRHNFSHQPVTSSRTCKDWRHIHHFAEQNALEWSAFLTEGQV